MHGLMSKRRDFASFQRLSLSLSHTHVMKFSLSCIFAIVCSTRLHASWSNDNTHCTAYLLRHLRKILLLTAVSHNHEATVACMHLAAMPTLTEEPHHLPSVTTMASNSSALANNNNTTTSRLRSSHSSSTIKKYDVNELRRQHDDEHGIVGLSVRLTMEDLERLDLVLQPLAGGGIDDPPLRMGEFLWKCLYHDPPPPTASIPLGDVEREIRQHLELELTVVVDPSGDESPEDSSSHHRRRLSEENDPAALRAMSRLTVADRHNKRSSDGGGGGETVGTTGRAKLETSNQHQKELTYTRLRGTTIVLKPNPPESSSGVSVASGDPSSSGRLHDIIVSDCSDAHFYLLQPFEHATIAACSGCTIVVGAVAGLLHVVDCDKVVITAASRRILVSNSCDVQLCIFSPSPPLLVGDYRACQFAPYNTYYDGLREDLLATGLAHAAVSDSQSPYHSNARNNDNEMAWLPLQCSSNKWRQPIEVSKLEVPQVPGSPGGLNPMVSAPLSPGADDRAMGTSGNDVSMQAPVLVPASDFSILFVPLENEAARQRRLEGEEGENATLMEGNHSSTMTSATPDNISNNNGGRESQYCRLLAEMLQLSPFRLPLEYERRALMKAERMKNIQQAVQKNLTVEQQRRFEEELNRGFRDWLVTSGNLRQVLDLVHLEIKGGV